MTIAISLKINDGIVLAADSASTLVTEESEVFNVYNNADKVFNLRKGLPIGVITSGAGNIGSASISTLIKDLRRRFSGTDNQYQNWAVGDKFHIEEIAVKFKEFIFDERYLSVFRDSSKTPSLGFIIAGYSSNYDMAEEYEIRIENGACTGPTLLRPINECGITWSGEGEAITRLILGHGQRLKTVLEKDLQVPQEQVQSAIEIIQQKLMAPLVVPPMPLQDAIDLAEFLVETTIKFSRYTPGAQTVGGPIEIAAISKHEGFKWIRRKHYYKHELNLEG